MSYLLRRGYQVADSWYRRAWAWLKDNWDTVLFGVLTLGVGIIVSKALKRGRVSTDAGYLESELIRSAAQDRETLERRQATQLKEERIAVIAAAHDEVVKRLTDKQASVMRGLLDSPEELNLYLLRIGREMRDE